MKDLEKDLESFLSAFRRKPVPPGLRTRILQQVQKQQDLVGGFTPAMRWLAAICLGLIAIISGGDFFLTLLEQRRLSAVFRPDQVEKPGRIQEYISLALPEINGGGKPDKAVLFLLGSGKIKPPAQSSRLRYYMKIKIMEEEFDGR